MNEPRHANINRKFSLKFSLQRRYIDIYKVWQSQKKKLTENVYWVNLWNGEDMLDLKTSLK